MGHTFAPATPLLCDRLKCGSSAAAIPHTLGTHFELVGSMPNVDVAPDVPPRTRSDAESLTSAAARSEAIPATTSNDVMTSDNELLELKDLKQKASKLKKAEKELKRKLRNAERRHQRF
jgi:hypothetical protein